MELPFVTFLVYQELLTNMYKKEDPEINKWRANAEQWRKKKIKG